MPHSKIYINETATTAEQIKKLAQTIQEYENLQRLHLHLYLGHRLLNALKKLALIVQGKTTLTHLNLHIHVEDYGEEGEVDNLVARLAVHFFTYSNFYIAKRTAEIICLMLQNKPNLSFLRLKSQAKFHTDHLNQLASVITTAPIRDLILQIHPKEDVFIGLDYKSSQLEYLEKFELRDTGNPYELLLLILRSHKLRELSLRGLAVDVDTASLIAAIIKKNHHSLVHIHLDLTCNFAHHDPVLGILDKIVRIQQLKHLGLCFRNPVSANKYGLWQGPDLIDLYKILKANPNLESLDLSHTRGLNDELRMVLSPLEQGHTKLTRLILNNANLSARDIKALVKFITSHSHLQHLEMDVLYNDNKHLEPKILKQLLHPERSGLTHLRCFHPNEFTRYDEEVLLQALKKNYRIRFLDIEPLSDFASLEINAILARNQRADEVITPQPAGIHSEHSPHTETDSPPPRRLHNA